MKSLIVTADDYGMCNDVDKAIDKGIENGFITTTNVMLNMESLENAKTLRERFPNISIGVHWNVTTGKPISDVKLVSSLVDENGNFWSIKEFKKRYSKKLISEKDLERELIAQYELFEKYCGKADYWNTHENSALHVKAFKVFEKVAMQYDIKATRTFKRVYYDKKSLGFKSSIREIFVRNFFNVWFTKIGKKFILPEGRIVSFHKISKTSGNILVDAILKSKKKTIEVVFHPAIVANNPNFGNIAEERVKEYEYVSSPQVLQTYKESNIKLINFSDLK